MSKLLSELKEACQHTSALSDDALIERGESTWLRGVPAHAEEGTVALGLGEDVRIVIKEEDVRAVTKDGDHYRVEVSSEANVLLRIEKAVKARLQRDCGCDGSRGSTYASREERGGGVTLGLGTVCLVLCADVVVDTGKQSMVVHICIPIECSTSPEQSFGD